MEYRETISKIKKYAIVSFVIPLLAINSCLMLYKFLGSIDSYWGFDWNKKVIEISVDEFRKIDHKTEKQRLTNCPKYNQQFYMSSYDGRKIKILKSTEKGWVENENLRMDLLKQNKIKSYIIEQGKIINNRCVKNHKLAYYILKKFTFLEKILLNTINNTSQGFGNIKNPYLYGEASISRTARYFPATLIFKPLLILSSFIIFFYWKNNLNIFRKFKNDNVIKNFSSIFFYLGCLSCIFLTLHALFFGLNIESKIFSQIRRLVITSFILFEVFAQFFLTKNLYTFKEQITNLINPMVLKIKIAFILLILIITTIAFVILSLDLATDNFKHIMEWNYFSILLFYYLLSYFLWKRH